MLKKFMLMFTAIIMVIGMTCTASAINFPPVTKPVEVWYNHYPINFPDQQPIIIDGRTMVPVRAVAEEMGFEVFWDAQKHEVQMYKDQRFIFWTIGDPEYRTNNGVLVTAECSPIIMNGRTMVPIRFVAQQLADLQVEFVSTNYCNYVFLDE